MKLSYVHSYFPQYDERCDGYVRIAEQTLSVLKLAHVMSGFDDELLAELRAAKCDAVGAGYTEWQTTFQEASQISVGWDWYVDRTLGILMVVNGDVRSNVMGTDCFGSDIGMTNTAASLRLGLGRLNWTNVVAVAMSFTPQHIKPIVR
ncbi:MULTISPECIES: DUF4902 domain-containing protein [unclassified Caballeronia]|uniref:DUF4902 domain-containing protein n=1 Tax=unclassified Caballeronia TaxID=2646786 RepID=UPI0013ED9CBA|nr:MULTISPECIES: DUF4902 domain-containing protein [unclassified Caballeronia]